MYSNYELLSFVLCIIFSGVFSGSEAVLLSVGIDRSMQIIEAGGYRGRAMKFMVDHSNELLQTILIGNNIVNILASSLVTTIAARFFQDDAIGYAVGFTTFIILIFGEIVPKTIARSNADALIFPVISFLKICYYAAWPAIFVLSFVMKKMLGSNFEVTGRAVTKDDIEYMVNKAEKENTIDSKQIDLLTSVMEFPTIKVRDIMIPRHSVKFVQDNSTYNELLKLVSADSHSRYPVCHGSLDHAIGFLHVKELARVEDREHFKLENVIKAPFFVYEHMKIQAVFDHMNRKKVHLALVKDENGLVVGIVTLEDIIEEIFGDISDEHDVEEVVTIDDYSDSELSEGIELDGSISIRDLYNDFDIKIPLNENFSTLAGFILEMLGNSFPEQGQIIVWEGYSFELVSVENFEIKKVCLKDLGAEHGNHELYEHEGN